MALGEPIRMKHEGFHVDCPCGKHHVREVEGKFTCACGRSLEVLWNAPVVGYKPARLAEIRVPDEAVERSGPVVVYWREGRPCR